MKLTTKNVRKLLKEMGPCKEGMKAFNKLLKQKKSMEFVFNKMSFMRRLEYEISYAHWMYSRVFHRVSNLGYKGLNTVVTFKNFKLLFEKLPEE